MVQSSSLHDERDDIRIIIENFRWSDLYVRWDEISLKDFKLKARFVIRNLSSYATLE